jgi:hypothetical protein
LTEENIFGYVGMLDRKTHYVPAMGVFDFFWTLRPLTRKRILEGWVASLNSLIEKEDFEPETIGGALLVFPHEDIVEHKESDNVVQFPTIPRSL